LVSRYFPDIDRLKKIKLRDTNYVTPQRNLTNSKEKSKILITMQKHAYYRFFQKEIIIKIRRSEDGPK
jgi:hypothetical protein